MQKSFKILYTKKYLTDVTKDAVFSFFNWQKCKSVKVGLSKPHQHGVEVYSGGY